VSVEMTVDPQEPLLVGAYYAYVSVRVRSTGVPTPVEVRVDFGGLDVQRIATSPPQCTDEGRSMLCRIEDVGDPTLLQFTVPASGVGTFPVVATAVGEGADPRPSDNVATGTVTVVPDSRLEVEVSPGTIRGDEVATVTGRVTAETWPDEMDLYLRLPDQLDLVALDETGRCERLTASVRCAVDVSGFPGTVELPPFGLEIADGLDDDTERDLTFDLDVDGPYERRSVTATLRLARADEADDDADDVPRVAEPAAAQVRRPAPFVVQAVAEPAGAVALASRVVPELPYPPFIEVVDAVDGTDAVTLLDASTCASAVPGCTPDALEGWSPAWSPDGTRLAVERDGAVHVATLADTGGDGPDVPEVVTAVVQLTGIAPDGTATPSRPLLSVTDDPAWSPDGTELAVTGQPAGHPDQRGIYALGLDGAVLREVAQRRGPETEPAYQPSTVVPEDLTADVGVDVTLDHPETWVGGQPVVATVAVTNAGPGAASGTVVTLAFPPWATVAPDPACPPPGTTCTLGTLAAGASRVLTATLTFPVPPPGPPGLEQPEAPSTATGKVTATVTTGTDDPVPANDTDAAELALRRPTLRLLPAVTKPGTVVLAYGENFPPGAAVDLLWSAGITVARGPAIVDDDGTVRFSVLVVRRDRLGERTLDATSPAALFGLVQGDLLVVPRSSSPPVLIARG
jgi:hypothetical protein